MNDNWKSVFTKLVEDYNAINRLQTDGIINKDMTETLRHKLLIDLISLLEKNNITQ